jgi:MFS family permease
MNAEPAHEITPEALETGLRRLMTDAAFATIVGTLNSGVVLIAYALWLGASPAVIGLLAAIPFLTQLLQAPSVALLERVRSRRLVSVAAVFVAPLALPLIALLAFLPDKQTALVLLVAGETIHCALNAVGGCAWNSWIRDLVPERRLSDFFARRTIWATSLGIVGTLTAAMALQWAPPDGNGGLVFSCLYAGGFLASLVSSWQLSLVPEPDVAREPARQPLGTLLAMPLKDERFRPLIRFMASWQFTVNLSVPFFTVYLIRQLHYSAGFVLLLSIVSQISNMVVLRDWSHLSNRFASKSVLAVSAPIFILAIAGMAFAGAFESRTVTTIYLIGLHAIMGMATAGVALASSTIGLKLAPRGKANAYVAANALVTAAAAGTAPLIAGLFADYFARRQLSLQLLWRTPDGTVDLVAMSFGWWQFFFLISAAAGLYALHRLSFVHEDGEVPPRELVQHVLNVARRGVRNASPVAGLRAAVSFPAGGVIDLHRRRVREPDGE